jgi:hypothetical protein
MGFFSSFRQVRQWIRYGRILVNSISVKSVNFRIKPGDFLSVKEDQKERVHKELIQKIGKKKILSIKPQHLEINYKILAGMVLFPPQQLYYPAPLKLEGSTNSTASQLWTSSKLKEKNMSSKNFTKIDEGLVSLKKSYAGSLTSRSAGRVNFLASSGNNYRTTRQSWRYISLKKKKTNRKTNNKSMINFFRNTKKKSLSYFSPELAMRSI